MNKTKPCRFCNQLFEFKSAKAQYCTEAHKKQFQRARSKKLDDQRKYRFSTSAFVYYLADSCRRSGTIEVLPKSLSELEKLYSLYKFSLKANAYGEDDQFSLCHIFPVTHPHSIGTMYAENLTVSYRDLNSSHSNGFTAGAGHKISRINLKPKWLVRKEDTKSSVVAKIVEYLGEDYTATIAVKLKLQPARRQAVLDWLASCTDDRVPALAEREGMTTAALSKLKAEITGKSAGYAPVSGINSNDVFLAELKRLSQHRPNLEKVIEPWLAATDTILPLVFDLQWCGPSESEYKVALEPLKGLRQAQFNLLHGGKIEDFLTALNTYHTSESLVLPFAPKVVPVFKDDTASQIEPTRSAIFTVQDYAELVILEAEFNSVIHPDLLEPNHFDIEDDIDQPVFELYKPKEKQTNHTWRYHT
ncbi:MULTISPECIES: hypothetical protein [Pseudomonas]|uniref:Uncharacterized protein n=1 Tax=Pseudomonas fulva TaxID=47880 RepID=A0A0D0KP56_9PSED|nr:MULTISPECIES: hypothetical protein [Pseudomonas]KIP98743.1 hypothetical protein RU08_14815 [Pseudomonas fulva]